MSRAVRIDPALAEPSAASHLASWYMPGLSDGLGDRLLMFDNTASASLELLRFRRDLGDVPVFEAAVRQRLRELERFDHAGIARVRAFKSLGDGEGLALVSNHTAGQRLSEVLHAARGPALGLDLIRQLTPALADLQSQGDDIAHGILTPERIIVTPEGRLVMVEHVLGSALQAVNLSPHRRADLGLVARAHDGLLGRRGDVVQLGLAALSLVLGRRIDPADYPLQVATLLDELELIDAPGASEFARLRRWMQHALQFGGRTFGSAAEAHEALREALEQRDTAPRENVIAFPAVPAEPPIEITSDEGRSQLRQTDAARAVAMPDLNIDVVAMWRSAQAHAPRGQGMPWRGPAAPRVDQAADSDGFHEQASAEDGRFATAARRGRSGVMLRVDAAGWQVPGLAPALGVLSLVQAGIIALLLAVPPTPEQIVVTRTITVPARSLADGAGQAARGGRAGLAGKPSPEAPVEQVSSQAMPQRPATFTENFVAGVREAPAAFGRAAAAAWRGTVAFAKDVFNRVREGVSQ